MSEPDKQPLSRSDSLSDSGVSAEPGSAAERSPLFTAPDGKQRCFWCSATEGYRHYHDNEWGFPVDNDQRLFEKLCLEGFQSGLSWRTILEKRENFRRAFSDFDVERVARFDEGDIERLLQDSGIVRHRGKIAATINNAQRALELIESQGSLAAFFWSYEPDPTPAPVAISDMRSTSPESVAMSKALKKLGWKFVGPTTAYSFMQSMGMVNDHLEGCETRARVEQTRAEFQRPSVAAG